jgi:hypothetical protein
MDETNPELNVQVPGDPAAAAGADGSASATDDASAARITELETTVAQQSALISQLSAAAAAVATVPTPPAKDPAGERRIIGEDWSAKTTSEAHAAGVKQTVLCSDGYYVP